VEKSLGMHYCSVNVIGKECSELDCNTLTGSYSYCFLALLDDYNRVVNWLSSS